MQSLYKQAILHICMPKPYIFGLLGLSWFHLFHKHVEFAKIFLHKICNHTINKLFYISVCQNHIFGLLGLFWLHFFHNHVEFAKYFLHKICKHTINMLFYISVVQCLIHYGPPYKVNISIHINKCDGLECQEWHPGGVQQDKLS